MNNEGIRDPAREIMRRMEELSVTADRAYLEWRDTHSSGSVSVAQPVIITDYSKRMCRVMEAVMDDYSTNFETTGSVWEIYSDDPKFFSVHIYTPESQCDGCWVSIEQPTKKNKSF